ncbi:MAG TPA: glutathione peroxidase [Myxococcota bacterium]|jgi:glutathione peroxidase|nr:glutathione peroxidase [Myxococcota bacterium]
MAHRTRLVALGAAFVATLALAAAAPADEGGKSVLDRSMKRLDGSEQNLADYKGQVVLMVNVASKCGLTPQYDGLEALYAKYKDRGFVVLGFPANDFAGQEPGSDAQIAEFCRSSYSIQFPMFSKITVKGSGMHPLYQELTSQPPPIGGEVKWNFQKYLLDRSGKPVARFDPQVKPDDPALVAKIEELLAKKS